MVQLAIAWAGEAGEEPRLGWWRSDLTSEFGGEDLFQRLLPRTWRWATLQGAREAARRTDAEAREKDHDPDRILSLFRVGFEVDERLDERLQELKSSGKEPLVALPDLGKALSERLAAGAVLRPAPCPRPGRHRHGPDRKATKGAPPVLARPPRPQPPRRLPAARRGVSATALGERQNLIYL